MIDIGVDGSEKSDTVGGGQSTRARAHGGGSRCVCCSGRDREKCSWLQRGTVGGWRAEEIVLGANLGISIRMFSCPVRHHDSVVGCETIHVRVSFGSYALTLPTLRGLGGQLKGQLKFNHEFMIELSDLYSQPSA